MAERSEVSVGDSLARKVAHDEYWLATAAPSVQQRQACWLAAGTPAPTKPEVTHALRTDSATAHSPPISRAARARTRRREMDEMMLTVTWASRRAVAAP